MDIVNGYVPTTSNFNSNFGNRVLDSSATISDTIKPDEQLEVCDPKFQNCELDTMPINDTPVEQNVYDTKNKGNRNILFLIIGIFAIIAIYYSYKYINRNK